MGREPDRTASWTPHGPRHRGGRPIGRAPAVGDSLIDRRRKNIRIARCGNQLGLAKGFIVAVETAGEKLHYLCLDRVRGLAGDDRMGAMFEKRHPWISKGPRGMSRRHADRCLAGFLALAVAVVAVVPPAAAAESEPGAKLPRFVSLRSDRVDRGDGPGETYPTQKRGQREQQTGEIESEIAHC